jgi:hypothetical protein
MNEKLKEIAVKAQVEHCVSHVRLQEFAELIVRECLDEIQYDDGATHVDELLPNHFGFEL